MARIVNQLSNLRIQATKKPGRYTGNRVYSFLSKTDNRAWAFRYANIGGSIHVEDQRLNQAKSRRLRLVWAAYSPEPVVQEGLYETRTSVCPLTEVINWPCSLAVFFLMSIHS